MLIYLNQCGLIGYIARENLKKIFKYLSTSTRLLQFLSDHMSLNYDDVTVVRGKKYLINESKSNTCFRKRKTIFLFLQIRHVLL